MADLKINDYTAATAIENTTSFIAQTVSNTTQRVPLSVIKSNIANDFMKNAELVYDGNGDEPAVGLTQVPIKGDAFIIKCTSTYIGSSVSVGSQTILLICDKNVDASNDCSMSVWVYDTSSGTPTARLATIKIQQYWINCINNDVYIYQIYKIHTGGLI